MQFFILPLLLFVISFTGIAVPLGTIFKDRKYTSFVFPSKSKLTFHICESAALNTVPTTLILILLFESGFGFGWSGPWLPSTRQPTEILDGWVMFLERLYRIPNRFLWEQRWVWTIGLHYSMLYELTFLCVVSLTFEPDRSMHADNINTIYVGFHHW